MKDFLLIDSTILNYNIFQTVVIYYIIYSSIRNINIILTSQYTEVNNKRHDFMDFFKYRIAIWTLINTIIFNISKYLNNFISKFFGQPKFFNTNLMLLIEVYILYSILLFYNRV